MTTRIEEEGLESRRLKGTNNTIKTVTQFVARIAEIKKKQMEQGREDDLLFRGQPCDKPLLPRLGRVRPRGELQKIEGLILNKFRRASPPLREFEPEDEWDLLALAQHHGLPTRLDPQRSGGFVVCSPKRAGKESRWRR